MWAQKQTWCTTSNEDYLQSVQSLKVPVSAAAVQGHFMQHKEDHSGAIDNVSCLTRTDNFKKIADWIKSNFIFLHFYYQWQFVLFQTEYTFIINALYINV